MSRTGLTVKAAVGIAIAWSMRPEWKSTFGQSLRLTKSSSWEGGDPERRHGLPVSMPRRIAESGAVSSKVTAARLPETPRVDRSAVEFEAIGCFPIRS